LELRRLGMNYRTLETVGTNDIEKMILLADDVLMQMMYNMSFYDDYGRSIYNLCWEKFDTEKERYVTPAHLIMKEQQNRDGFEGIQILILNMLKDRIIDLGTVRKYTSDDLMEKLQPIRNRIIGVFRNGSEQDTAMMHHTSYCADDTVSDDYLLKLFAMRLRDKMIVNAAQRLETRIFLLVKDQSGKKEYIGVYDEERDVRDTYFKLSEEMTDNSCDAAFEIYIFYKDWDCLKQECFKYKPEDMKWAPHHGLR
jgi:hypothetical protein